MTGVYIFDTYLFFELYVFFSEVSKLAADPICFLVFLNAAFEGAFPILKKSPLPLGHAALLDFQFNLLKLRLGIFEVVLSAGVRIRMVVVQVRN